MELKEYLKDKEIKENARFDMFDQEDYAFGWCANLNELIRWFGDKELISFEEEKDHYSGKSSYKVKILVVLGEWK